MSGTPARGTSAAFGTPVPAGSGGAGAGLTEEAVADFLISRKYHLAALELHQELLEGNNGVHNVARLNTFFNNPKAYQSLLEITETRARQNKAEGAWLCGRGRAGGVQHKSALLATTTISHACARALLFPLLQPSARRWPPWSLPSLWRACSPPWPRGTIRLRC